MKHDNPRNIAALIMSDVSPRWLYGHSIVVPPEYLDEQSRMLALVAERIGILALHVEEMGLPAIAVESTCLGHYAIHTLSGKCVALCGVYGGLCVDEVGRWLMANGVSPVFVRDAIVWSGVEPHGVLSTELFPGCYVPEWLRAPRDLVC